MGQFFTRLRNVALFMLIVTGPASLAAAGQAGTPGQNMSKTLRKSDAISSPSWTPSRTFIRTTPGSHDGPPRSRSS